VAEGSACGRRPRLLFVVTEDWYFCSHRLPLARAAIEAGFDVTVATRVAAHSDLIRAAGVRVIPLGWRRRSTNPIRELMAVGELRRVMAVERPDIVHNVAMKPVLYGSIAARLARVPRVLNALAGMGYIFTSRDLRARLLRPTVKLAFRAILDRPGSRLILQNPDDRALFVSSGLVSAERVVLIRGSGVDTAMFAATAEPAGVPIVMLASRMLRDKGVLEFVEAARRLQREGVMARFVLVGEPDPENPASLSSPVLRQLATDAVEWWGPQTDMPGTLAQASLVCLPSYREGLPKVLLEAASCARAIVATDVPGCREVVRDGDNGLLVPARDANALAAALRALIDAPEERRAMGVRGRRIVETEFALERTLAETVAVYRDLLRDIGLNTCNQERL
jgi:glycosyltransferase involved in cell wall biosynthesis